MSPHTKKLPSKASQAQPAEESSQAPQKHRVDTDSCTVYWPPGLSPEESCAHLTLSLPDKHPDLHTLVSESFQASFIETLSLGLGPGPSAAGPKALGMEQNLVKCLVIPYSLSPTSYHQSPLHP